MQDIRFEAPTLYLHPSSKPGARGRLFGSATPCLGLCHTVRPRKVDPVLAVGIWVGFGTELGSEKSSPRINKKLSFHAFYKPNLPIINKDISMGYS